VKYKIYIYVISLTLLLFGKFTFAQKFKIGLWINSNPTTIIFTPLAGNYRILLEWVLLNPENTAKLINIVVYGDFIEIKSVEKEN